MTKNTPASSQHVLAVTSTARLEWNEAAVAKYFL